LLTASRVVLVAHRSPDGDALGAVTAMLNWLDSAGKEVIPFCVSLIPNDYGYLYGVNRFVLEPNIFKSTDLICVLDTGTISHTGLADYLEAAGRQRIINIDHHNVNTSYGEINLVLPGASSTSEIIYRLLKSFGAKFDSRMATSLLTGIITDTSLFINAATSTEAMAAAGELLRAGAEYNKIHRRLFVNKSISSLGIWGLALSRLKYNEEYGIATTVIRSEDFNDAIEEEAMEGLTNYLCATLRVPIILALRETADGKIKGSLRTVENIDVSAFARALGGGGHKKAAGFTMEGKLEETDDGWRIV
jgi:phosphoesterase RecJ-like protein